MNKKIKRKIENERQYIQKVQISDDEEKKE